MKTIKTLALLLALATTPALAQDDIGTLIRENGRNAWLNQAFGEVGSGVAKHVVKLESQSGKHLGYGVAIEGGYILTANGILPSGQATLRAVGAGDTYSASIAARNTTNDVALLKVAGDGPAPIAFGSSQGLKIGQFVGTIGRSGQVLAVGVISAKNRPVDPSKNQKNILMGMFSDGNDGPSRSYPKVLQHDGPVQPEHFGSPLVDAQGRLVGINVATPYRGSSHAVGIDQIGTVLGQLKQGASEAPAPTRIRPPAPTPSAAGPRPFLGIKAAEETENLPPRYACGIEVREAQPGSPALKSGLKAGDLILEVAGQKFASIDGFAELVGQHKPGDAVDFSVLRGGAVLVKVKVTLGSR